MKALDASTWPAFAALVDDAGRLATNCEDTRALVEHITSKWGVVVLLVLTEGTLRWSELKRRTKAPARRC